MFTCLFIKVLVYAKQTKKLYVKMQVCAFVCLCVGAFSACGLAYVLVAVY